MSLARQAQVIGVMSAANETGELRTAWLARLHLTVCKSSELSEGEFMKALRQKLVIFALTPLFLGTICALIFSAQISNAQGRYAYHKGLIENTLFELGYVTIYVDFLETKAVLQTPSLRCRNIMKLAGDYEVPLHYYLFRVRREFDYLGFSGTWTCKTALAGHFEEPVQCKGNEPGTMDFEIPLYNLPTRMDCPGS